MLRYSRGAPGSYDHRRWAVTYFGTGNVDRSGCLGDGASWVGLPQPKRPRDNSCGQRVSWKHDIRACQFNVMPGMSGKILGYRPIPSNSKPYAARQNYGQKESLRYEESPNGLLCSVFAQKFLVNRDPVNALLGKLKCCKENGVHDTRTAHGHAET